MSRFTCDPSLTGNLNAEYQALQNDLEQAKLLASDYQSKLSDKTNDYAALKQTLEKTFADLNKLQLHIVALRQERHNLANEVLKVVLLEAKLATAESRIVTLEEELKRDRTGKRDPKREFIEVSLEDPSLTIIPTTVEKPRSPKPYTPR